MRLADHSAKRMSAKGVIMVTSSNPAHVQSIGFVNPSV
jgi:hypothetical protein